MKYRIKIFYRTGNSYEQYNTECFLDEGLNNIEIAKENLARIKAHHEMLQAKNAIQYPHNTKLLWENEFFKKYDHKQWFVKETKPFAVKENEARAIDKSQIDRYEKNGYAIQYVYDDIAEDCLNLLADNGNHYRISCFWCGYFERLLGAEILADESDMKFTIN